MTGLFVKQNVLSREATVDETTAFLRSELADAKHSLDDQDAKLADFQRQNYGKLPTDANSNANILGTLDSQLDATTQTLARAQQDKAYTESMLAQQVAAWKSSQSTR